MIPNLLNTLVGLWLAFAAIFPMVVASHRVLDLAFAAGATIGLAIWSRRSDAMTWHSTGTMVAGAWLGLLLIIQHYVSVSAVVEFWIILWMGLISSTFSLWAMLYRPSVESD